MNKKQLLAKLNMPTRDSRFSFWSYEDTLNYSSPVNRNILSLEECNIWSESLSTLYSLFDNPEGSLLAIDFETTSSNPLKAVIKGIGLSDGLYHHYIVTDSVDDDELTRLLIDINEHFTLCAHNAKYEYKCAYLNYDIKLNISHDTMIAAYIAFNQPFPKLSSLAKKLLNRNPKDYIELLGRKTAKDDDCSYIEEIPVEQLAPYCCEDCYETLLLVPILQNELDRTEQSKVYDIDMKCMSVLCDMELHGIRIDIEESTQLAEDFELELEILNDEVTCCAGYDLNVKSPKQLNQFFFNELKLPTDGLEKNVNGYSINNKAREFLKSFHPIVNTINNFIKLRDLNSKYVRPLPVIADGNIIHTEFRNCQTVTGRLSSANPNLQNIPNPGKYLAYGDSFMASVGSRIRGLFKPREGYCFVRADYSSFELRILAHLSQDNTLLKVFRDGDSLHDIMTIKLFQLDYLDKNNPTHKAWRTLTKVINFGIAYGMTEHRLYSESRLYGLDYSIDECKNFITEYFEKLPKLKAYFDHIKMKAIVYGYSETMFGRKRFYEWTSPYLKSLAGSDIDLDSKSFEMLKRKNEINTHDTSNLRKVGNHPPQGTNGDAIRLAMAECSKRFSEIDSSIRIVLNVHDELVVECPIHLANVVSHQLKEGMESVIQLDVPVIAEPSVIYQWG